MEYFPPASLQVLSSSSLPLGSFFICWLLSILFIIRWSFIGFRFSSSSLFCFRLFFIFVLVRFFIIAFLGLVNAAPVLLIQSSKALSTICLPAKEMGIVFFEFLAALVYGFIRFIFSFILLLFGCWSVPSLESPVDLLDDARIFSLESKLLVPNASTIPSMYKTCSVW